MLTFLFALWGLLIISNFLVITIYTKKYKKAPYTYQMIAYIVIGIVAMLCAIFLESVIAMAFVFAAAFVSFVASMYSFFAKMEYENAMKELKEAEELYNQMTGNK